MDGDAPEEEDKDIKAFFNEKYEVPQMRLRTTICKHEA
jgi:hypothetical protein